jgi:hypothetical protein
MDRPDLRQLALMIVAEHQPMSPYDLVARLQREAGASAADANRTMFELLRSGQLKSGFRGVTVGGSRRDGGGSHMLGNTAAVLGIVAALLSIWEIGARTDLLPVRGPWEQFQGFVMPTAGEDVVVPNVVGQQNTTAFYNLGQAGLVGLQEGESSATVPFGKVIRTEPKAGKTVARGSTVVFYVSTGP